MNLSTSAWYKIADINKKQIIAGEMLLVNTPKEQRPRKSQAKGL